MKKITTIVNTIVAIAISFAITMMIIIKGMFMYIPTEFYMFAVWMIILFSISITIGSVSYVTIMSFFEKLEKKEH